MWRFVLRCEFLQKPIQIEVTGKHRQFALRSPGPGVSGSIPIELDSIFIRVTQVQGFADAVVAGPVERYSCGKNTTESVGQGTPGRIQDGGVE